MRHTFRYMVATPPPAGATLVLGEEDSHHLARVVRRRAGDALELIDGAGGVWPATVVEPGPPSRVRVSAPRVAAPPAPVHLYQGLAEWGRIDLVVEKAAELGVGGITLYASRRCRRVPDDEAWTRRRGRLLRVAEAAARQSGRAHLPEVRGLWSLDRVLAAEPRGRGRLFDPSGLDDGGAPPAGGSAGIAVLVGPDAGLDDDEVAAARAAGWAVCGLGSGVLRAETAALVALTLALRATGALRPAPAG